MPQKVLCSNCGHVLYEDEELVQPVEILKKFEFKCPHCLRPLEAKSVKVLRAAPA